MIICILPAPCIIATVRHKFSTVMHKLLPIVFVLFAVFYGVYTTALFIQIRLFKILVSPTPQVIIISTTIFIVVAILWVLLASQKKPIKSAWFTLTVITINSLFVLFCLIFTLTIQAPAQLMANTKPLIKMTNFNRQFDSSNNGAPTEYMKTIESDIVSIQEASTPNYTKNFAEKIGHQYYIQAPDNDTGLTSRWPIVNSKILQNGSKQVIRADLATDQGDLVVYAVHITPPFTNSMYNEGLKELNQLNKWVAQETMPVAIGGDFNTTIYSPEMRIYTNNLTDRVKPTTEQRWPKCSWYGHGKLLCLRIDHIFIPQSSNFYGSTISPDLGSDHRAITVRFSL